MPALQLLGGGVRLALDCVAGVARSVEKMHATIAKRPMPWARLPETSLRAPGLVSGSVYAAVHGVQRVLREGVTRGIDVVAERSEASRDVDRAVAPLAIVNGVCGDHLEATGNPLAIPMSLRSLDGAVEWTPEEGSAAFGRVSPRVVVWVHGLCMSERNWSRKGGTPMSEHLGKALDATCVYVRYNTGRRISANGRDLSDRLERLVAAWPVPVESISLVGHSMGGLVIRSAGWHAEQDGRSWRRRLRKVVCLGTPHHGSPLEKGGHLLTQAMKATPYLNPLAFGDLRSAGIKDLRHGNLLDDGWGGRGPRRSGAGGGPAVPLLDGVDYYFAAATVGRREGALAGRLVGDLLVRPESAVGAHDDERRRIPVPIANCRIFRNMNHLDLLDHPAVHDQLQAWLTEGDVPTSAQLRGQS